MTSYCLLVVLHLHGFFCSLFLPAVVNSWFSEAVFSVPLDLSAVGLRVCFVVTLRIPYDTSEIKQIILSC